MLLQLQRYDLEFIYKRGKELYIADTLSRAYTGTKHDTESDSQLEVMSVIPISPVNSEGRAIESHTLRPLHAKADPVYQQRLA